MNIFDLTGRRVWIIDDVLATGGTLAAAAELVALTEAEIIGAAVVIEIAVLAGRARWRSESPLHALITYD